MHDDFNRRLVAEAIREIEKSEGRIFENSQAERTAAQASNDFEQRLIIRAASLEEAAPVKADLLQLRQLLSATLGVLCLLALLGGWATAQSVMTVREEATANIYLVLGGLLGVQSLALLAWLLFGFFGSRSGAVMGFGSLLWFLAGKLFQHHARGPRQLAVWRAVARGYQESGLAKWQFGLASHLIWLCFGLGALITLVVLLSARHYHFVWETTILSVDSFEQATLILAKLPSLMGFSVPDAQMIKDSQWPLAGKLDAGAGGAWSGFLFGCLVIYGLLPRTGLALLCWQMERRCKERYRLDPTHPEYQRLQGRLSGAAADTPSHPHPLPPFDPSASPRRSPPPAIRQKGLVGLMGLDLQVPITDWPPAASAWTWSDLGFVENRADRQEVSQKLHDLNPQMAAVVVVAELTSTPDRGICNYLGDLQDSSELALLLVLTAKKRLEGRVSGQEFQERLADWQRLAAAANIPVSRVLVIDFDLPHPPLEPLAQALAAKQEAGR